MKTKKESTLIRGAKNKINGLLNSRAGVVAYNNFITTKMINGAIQNQLKPVYTTFT